MLASALDASYHRPSTKGGSVASRLLRRLNMGTLAFAMFVALALLSNTQGKDAGPRKYLRQEQQRLRLLSITLAFRRKANRRRFWE